jgi:hypothetical protein
MTLHVIHFTVHMLSEPVLQMLFIISQVNVTDAYLLKPKLGPPVPDAGGQADGFIS